MMDRPEVMLRYQALDMARELLRTDNHSDDLLAEAMRIEAYMLGVAPQEDAQVGIAAGMTVAMTGHIDPPTSNVITLPLGAEAGAEPAQQKERKPRKVKAAKAVKAKRGRPKKVAADVAANDGPITNGAGEPHVETPAVEPPQMAA